MTQRRSSIILNRLVIMAGSHVAYDQPFHKGINIIRSAGNSTGKSTIMDFIFFVLGGFIEEWTDEAKRCDTAIAEFLFNGEQTTIKREIGENRHPPIYMFEGGYDESLNNPSAWLKFLHKRSSERESFSQAFFRLLGYPESKLSNFSNITIHELLRLIYCDQLTAVNNIFKQQDFDPEEMRLTVGEFLLGVDNLDLHSLRLQLRETEKELATLSGRLKATRDVLIEAGLSPDIQEIRKQIEHTASERSQLRERINILESKAQAVRKIDESEEIKKIRSDLLETKTNLKKNLDRRETLSYEVEDSLFFINSIKDRLAALNESEATRESLGELKFEFCPACLSRIEGFTEDTKLSCHLCKKEHSEKTDITGHLRMQFELNYQLKESEQLIDLKKSEIVGLIQHIENAHLLRNQLQERYNSFITTADPVAAELKDALTRIGHFDKVLENLNEKSKLIGIIEEISQRKSELTRNISLLSDQIETNKKKRESRWQEVRKRISEITVYLLQKDVPSEESFANAEEFEFDFAKNKLLVDGRSKFSASSVCYLKSAFYFALLLVSVEDSQVRYPRFSLLDNIEDKGATPERVQNMHKLFLDLLKDVEVENQVILTTSVLAPELNNSSYCVGPEYSFNLKTLSLP